MVALLADLNSEAHTAGTESLTGGKESGDIHQTEWVVGWMDF